MSGLEVLAIPALVASVISAFSGATSLYRSWRKDRKERRQKAENEELQSLVSTSGTHVQEEYDLDFRRMGQRFAEGDEISRWALAQQVMTLQATVIRLLSKDTSLIAASAVLHPYHSELTFHTTSARDASISALGELFQRKVQAAPVQRGPRVKSSRRTLYAQHHNPPIEAGPSARLPRNKSSRLALYAQDDDASIESAAGRTGADENEGRSIGLQGKIVRHKSGHQKQPMTLRRDASPPSREDMRVSRQGPFTSKAKPSKQKSQTSLLIEYFEAGTTGNGKSTKPSVRVKVKPRLTEGAQEYDAVQVQGIGKNRKPSYTRHIFLQDGSADYAADEASDPSHLHEDRYLLPTIPPSLSIAHEALRADMAPRQAYVESVAGSTLGAAKPGVSPSPDELAIDELRWLPAWAAQLPSQSIPQSKVVATTGTAGQDSPDHNFVSHEVNGGNDSGGSVGTVDAAGEATSCMATLGLDARKLGSAKKRRVRFRPEVKLAAEPRQERTSPPRSRGEIEIDGDRTVTTLEHSMPMSNARDCSASQDLITQKVMEKLAQNSAKTRKSSMIRRYGEHRLKISSILHGLDEDAVRDAGSTPLHSRSVAAQLAHRPATAQRQPTINNPELLEMVELTIKRMILPDLCSNKLNQKVEDSAVVDIADHDISVGGELVEMAVEGERPAAGGRQEAEINEVVSHLDYRNVHLPPEQRNAGYNCFERLTVTGDSILCTKCQFHVENTSYLSNNWAPYWIGQHDLLKRITTKSRHMSLDCMLQKFHFCSLYPSLGGTTTVYPEQAALRCFLCKSGKTLALSSNLDLISQSMDAFQQFKNHIERHHTWEESCGGSCGLLDCGARFHD
ncbi:hypothetical protein LTR95_011190 [Oleoguttula sp. CCFEE 5521]